MSILSEASLAEIRRHAEWQAGQKERDTKAYIDRLCEMQNMLAEIGTMTRDDPTARAAVTYLLASITMARIEAEKP